MRCLLLTGASRGIGRALALALADPERMLLLTASSEDRLQEVAREVQARGGQALVFAADLSSLDGARALAEQVRAQPIDTVVHNAGLWPRQRELVPISAKGDGPQVERAFMINHLAPLALQQQLNALPTLKRVVFVSAGLIAMGRWDRDKTPSGHDFSPFRSYCTTKLCGAFAAQGLAAERPDLEVVAFHPGVVRTDLGQRGGGWLDGLAAGFKRMFFEAPERCAERAAQVILHHRPERGRCAWLDEATPKPWPQAAQNAQARAEVHEVSAALLG